MASRVFMEGVSAFKRGGKIENNPYHIELEEDNFMTWEDGFLDASLKASSKEEEYV